MLGGKGHSVSGCDLPSLPGELPMPRADARLPGYPSCAVLLFRRWPSPTVHSRKHLPSWRVGVTECAFGRQQTSRELEISNCGWHGSSAECRLMELRATGVVTNSLKYVRTHVSLLVNHRECYERRSGSQEKVLVPMTESILWFPCFPFRAASRSAR